VLGSFTQTQIKQVIAAAGAAPSIHNTQPWRFSLAGDELIIAGVPDRALWVADPAARALYISCGAALFNARIAIRVLGYDPQVRLLPHPRYRSTCSRSSARPQALLSRLLSALAESIWRRHTNRGPFSDREIPASVRAELMESAPAEHASLRLVARADAAQAVALAAEAGRELAASAEHDSELHRWVGVDRPDANPAAAVAGARPPAAEYERFPQLAVLTTDDDEPAD
jgi:hypothetical protein